MSVRIMAWAAAAWALLFGVLHVLWAAGFYIGLDAKSAAEGFQNPLFLAYDIVVAFVCALGFVVALALSRPSAPWFPPRLLAALAWTGTVVLTLRGAAGITQTIYLAVARRVFSPRATFWELWFCLGATLFGVATWQSRRRAARAAPESA